jgi:hypothetical protein
MQKFELKKLQYGKGLKKINELALKTLFIFEPNTTLYNPLTEGIRQMDQVEFADPSDPLVYVTDIDWPSPLPVDKLIKLNEIQGMMAMNLESRRGALKELGEQFPDEKLREIFDELVEDANRDGALRMIQAQVDSAIQELTGLLPQPDGTLVPPTPQTDGEGNPVKPNGGPNSVSLNDDVRELDGMGAMKAMQSLVAQAYGTKLGVRQIPTDDDN